MGDTWNPRWRTSRRSPYWATLSWQRRACADFALYVARLRAHQLTADGVVDDTVNSSRQGEKKTLLFV